MPIQQMLLGAGGAVATKTYVDDVFSTFLYEGTSSSHTINNGINFSGEGGLVWFKNRSSSYSHSLIDTVRGKTKRLTTNDNIAEVTWTDTITSFNNNGFTLGTSDDVNDDDMDFTSWSFRKAPGFFDVVKFTSDGSTQDQRISHSLGCVPGFICVKNLELGERWWVYHRETGGDGWLSLNETYGFTATSQTRFDATATDFGFNSAYFTSNNKELVAYVFAGGESTAATACSVNFNGASDYLTHHSGLYGFGTGDFTIEFWFKSDDEVIQGGPGFFQLGHSLSLQDDYKFITVIGTSDNGGEWEITIKGTSTVVGTVYSSAGGDGFSPGQWYHVALVRHSSKTSLYVNGTQKIGPIDDTTNYNFDDLLIGSYVYNDYGLDGQISNFRIVKGSAVYTSSFRPPTEPLTSITNTLLLCCQSSTITTATTKPGSYNIGTNGSPSASTSHPFDDPAGFKFGEDGDQGIIKCGSYVGNGDADGPEISLGWEPQYVLIKADASGENWYLQDTMRGMPTVGNTRGLIPNNNGTEFNISPGNVIVTSTGFKITSTRNEINKNNTTNYYVAIRRPDGYVGKPPELGTDVFHMLGASSTNAPPWYKPTDFPVDFAFARNFASTENWSTGSRLTGKSKVSLNLTDAASDNDYIGGWDYQSGWNSYNGSESNYQAWMWKRHAGFDVVTYKGDHVDNRQLSHSLSKSPEMIWTKVRDTSGQNWVAWHTGMPNSGDSENATAHALLNLDNGVAHTGLIYGGTDAVLPTSTHWSVGTHETINDDNYNYIAMLFASVDGISKVGYYTGDGSSSRTITTGFAPRFIIWKNITDTEFWFLLDTTRGWGSGNDNYLVPNNNIAQLAFDFGAPTSTGFTTTGYMNTNNKNYIYYAHA